MNADIVKHSSMFSQALLVACALVFLSACEEQAPPTVQTRPVRTIIVERKTVGEPVTLTGQIHAQDEVSLAFRIDGRMTERLVSVGDRVEANQLIAKLDSQNEVNAERSAKADLSAAQASLVQTQGAEDRLRELLAKGYATRTQYDQALQQLQTAKAQVEVAQARLRTAQDRVSYTELRADAPGTVTAKGAESREVVTAGKMIVQLARKGGRDAVFNVPAHLLRDAPTNPVIEVWLADNPSVKTTGLVREVAPQAEAATRTFPVKIGLSNPPEAMRLGATVVGQITLNASEAFQIPATALTESNGKPAVWIVEPENQTVVLREVNVLRYDANAVIISEGLQNGETVVTAGVHVLRPGQKVTLLGASS
jgi:membrane fusion protein, multidrug efflux system